MRGNSGVKRGKREHLKEKNKMERKKITPNMDDFPEVFHTLIRDSKIYDSSCSKEARVVYIDKDNGYYLKSAPKGSLKTEAELTAYFHKKGLATEVLSYYSAENDWMLTERVPGEDCTYFKYLEDPERLCDTFAGILRELHSVDFSDCPVQNRINSYLDTALKNYKEGNYDTELFPDNWGYSSAEEAWRILEENKDLLKNDTLIHGDYCLPNIMLDDWRFSGFIDLGNGGVGDKHIDLFWGAWTLNFNLKTDKYRNRFLDAYGRSDIEEEIFRVIAAAEVFG